MRAELWGVSPTRRVPKRTMNKGSHLSRSLRSAADIRSGRVGSPGLPQAPAPRPQAVPRTSRSRQHLWEPSRTRWVSRPSSAGRTAQGGQSSRLSSMSLRPAMPSSSAGRGQPPSPQLTGRVGRPGGVGLSAEAPPTNERSSGSKGGRAPGLCAFSQGSGPRGQGQGVRPAPGASARPWPMGATASEAAFGQRTRMLPFSPETRARGRAAKAPRRRPDGGLCSRPPGQHRPCLREPGQGGLTSCGPQDGESRLSHGARPS